MKFYTIKDEDGVIRPVAGVWVHDEYGKQSAERALQDGDTIVVVEIIEVV